MARYYRSYRRPIRKSRRPSNKIIRAGYTTVTSGGTVTGYLYTATEPQTAMSIKLDLGMTYEDVGDPIIAYCLVVVREGYNANGINYPALTDDMYNPTQDVLIGGVLTDSTSEDHRYARVGRKLKPGDRLALLFYSPAGNPSATFEINFTTLH